MEVTGIISAIVVGAVIGGIAQLALPGRANMPVWLTILIGIVGALIGSAIVGTYRDTEGVDWIEILVQVVLAAIGITLVAGVRGRNAVR